MSTSEFRDEQGRYASPPEGGPPAANGPPPADDPWEQVRAAGITPEQALQGGRFWNDVNDLDRRQQAIQSIYRPDIDTWLQPTQAEQEQDPFAEYGPQEQYEEEPQQYQQPYQEPPPFDPREFASRVAGTAEERAYQRVMTELQGMMAAQQFQDAAEAVTKEYGLPASDAAYIDWQARQVAAQQPNRAPADIAREIATKRQAEFQAWQATSMPPPSAQPATPGGPVPSSFQPPSSDEEAMRLSRELLDQ